MRADDLTPGIAKIAVEINPVFILALVQAESSRVEAGNYPDVQAFGPLILLKQLEDGERSGRFIAMNSG